MQNSYENILGVDFNDPLHYFDTTAAISRTTPPIYADDPWSTAAPPVDSPNAAHVMDSYFIEQDAEQEGATFGSHLTMSNVLMGVDVPDIYYDVYRKANPDKGKVALISLNAILTQLSGLPLYLRQQITSWLLITSTDSEYVTRNEFNVFLALIACGQKNMEMSLENVYQHRNDLPIPTFINLESFNITKIDSRPPLVRGREIVSSSLKKEDGSAQKIDISNRDSSSSTTMLQPTYEQKNLYRARHRQEQEAMNQWFRDLDHITVSRTPQKEGFLFKHINYEVGSEKLGCKVLRRYSDFYWLWEILLKRYPFRILPNLPPKQLGGRNALFEERRRKGLVRFINAVVRHPILGQDDVVKAFLNHPSEINSWKRANTPNLDEEFVKRTHNIAYLERMIPLDLEDRLSRLKKRLSASAEEYEHMCFIMNQMNRLQMALGTDYMRYSVTLNSVGKLDKDCWLPDCQGCSQIITGYDGISKSMHQAGMMLGKQAIATGDSIVEGLKRQRDLLGSFKELLDRREKLNPLSNETLARQVARYKKGKIQPSLAHDDIPSEQQRGSERIWDEATGLTLVQQRDIFMKYCFISELSYLHKQQASVSIMYNTYVRDQVRYARQWSEHWKILEVITSEMPNSPDGFF